MKVVITGGAGYIGCHVALELMAAGFEPVLFDNFSNASPAVLSALERLAGRPVPCVEGDIRERSDLDRVLRNGDVSAVLHLAASKAVAESIENPLHYYDNNLAGFVGLVKQMEAHGLRTLVFSSTAAVYASANGPIEEGAPLAPSNPYARTKLAAEAMLQDLHAADPRWSVSILRYFNVGGAHPSGLLGETPVGPARNLLPRLADVAVGRSSGVAIFGNDYPTRDGTCIRDYVHVSDVARGHVRALERVISRPGVSLHNLGSGCGHSVLEVIAAFKRISGAAVPYWIAPPRPGDAPALFASRQRAASELGWAPMHDLDAICADLWRSRSLAQKDRSPLRNLVASGK